MFSHELKNMRRLAGWTQQRLARATGINRTKLSQAETGDIDLTPDETVLVRHVLAKEIKKAIGEMQRAINPPSEGK